MEPIIGIDLGTTNSEVSFLEAGAVTVICDNDEGIMPSCVGLNREGQIVAGAEAKNQAVAAPERTVLSIKRKMGSEEQVALGPDRFTPQEISAFILKALKERATRHIGRPVTKAVITVPAYFTDAQRQATREAGQIAGLEVMRIINEPTAAALAYESNNKEAQRILVYDLGGGTFDVSIVRIEEGVVEVLSSAGDNHLGGDDFDRRIAAHLAEHLKTEKNMAIRESPALMARLRRAAEKAKIALSASPHATVEEDHIGRSGNKDIHLSLELARSEFEAMIEPDLARTMESVNQALKDAGMLPSAIDKIILVGGSTRIPLVMQMLEEKFGKPPQSHIDPDLCVAMGAGIQAAREMGIEDSGVLVDITPYTFGTSAVGEVCGMPCMTMFVPMIRRNSKLPARRGELFYTMVDGQKAVDMRIYQGEKPDAEDNILLGNYMFDLTDAPAGSEIVIHFDLDLNGILKVQAVEKKTGRHFDATIENAISRFSDEALAATRNRIDRLWAENEASISAAPSEPDGPPDDVHPVIQRAKAALSKVPEDDQVDIINLIEDIKQAGRENRMEDVEGRIADLEDMLFYLDV